LRTDKDKEIEMTVLRRQPKENADLQRRVGELTGQVQEEMRRREELKSRHQIALQTLQKEFTEKLAQLAKDMRDLREEIVKKEAYIKDLEEGNTRQKTTISGAEDALQQKQRAIEDLEREKTYWHDTSTKMQEMIDNLSGELYRKSQEKPHKKKKGKHSVTERKESML
jgi:chromosome segregation ATPase